MGVKSKNWLGSVKSQEMLRQLFLSGDKRKSQPPLLRPFNYQRISSQNPRYSTPLGDHPELKLFWQPHWGIFFSVLTLLATGFLGFIFFDGCVSEYIAHVYRCLWRLKEDIRSGTGGSSGSQQLYCELPDVGAGIWNQVLWMCSYFSSSCRFMRTTVLIPH